MAVGDPSTNRTCDLRFRKASLYPAELWDRVYVLILSLAPPVDTLKLPASDHAILPPFGEADRYNEQDAKRR